MGFFDALDLIGGLSLFLFGMTVMGNALEKSAGNSLKNLLEKLTTGKLMGFLTGLGVTAVIQSSSATTVMVVGFVNSGIMSLKQAINVIMGANVGTTVTAWLLSLTGIDGSSFFMKMLKPSSFTPILGIIGIYLYMMGKSSRRKDIGMIMLGFTTLMTGMDVMSGAVSGLKNVPEFTSLMTMFTNPILGVVAGAVLTAIIQSSSASVGILQALSVTGQVSYGAAIPIIMGQNIGTCVTAMLSSVGTSRNARRAALAHLFFNIIGTAVWLTVFCVFNAAFPIPFIGESIDKVGISIVHTAFNVLCTALLLPMSGLLEKLACGLIPDGEKSETASLLDERLMSVPAVALARSHSVAERMAEKSSEALNIAMRLCDQYEASKAERVRELENETDIDEDSLGTYLVRLSRSQLNDEDSRTASTLLHVVGDFERIADHSRNIVESAEELKEKKIVFTPAAKEEFAMLTGAVSEIVALAMNAFVNDDMKSAALVEPLEQVVDNLKEKLRNNHITRMQNGECSIEAGFVWSDLLNDLERVADHCTNIAGCVTEMKRDSYDLHGYADRVKASGENFDEQYREFARKYALNSTM